MSDYAALLNAFTEAGWAYESAWIGNIGGEARPDERLCRFTAWKGKTKRNKREFFGPRPHIAAERAAEALGVGEPGAAAQASASSSHAGHEVEALAQAPISVRGHQTGAPRAEPGAGGEDFQRQRPEATTQGPQGSAPGRTQREADAIRSVIA